MTQHYVMLPIKNGELILLNLVSSLDQARAYKNNWDANVVDWRTTIIMDEQTYREWCICNTCFWAEKDPATGTSTLKGKRTVHESDIYER